MTRLGGVISYFSRRPGSRDDAKVVEIGIEVTVMQKGSFGSHTLETATTSNDGIAADHDAAGRRLVAQTQDRVAQTFILCGTR